MGRQTLLRQNGYTNLDLFKRRPKSRKRSCWRCYAKSARALVPKAWLVDVFCFPDLLALLTCLLVTAGGVSMLTQKASASTVISNGNGRMYKRSVAFCGSMASPSPQRLGQEFTYLFLVACLPCLLVSSHFLFACLSC